MLTLLRLLQDGCFHSGQDLGDALGVSRSAVWKQLQRLESEMGVLIHKVRGRGYQLAKPVSLLEAEGVLLPEGWSLHIRETVDSTNAEAMRLLMGGQSLPFVVLSERQTAGRGRRGRNWLSPFAENIYYSLALRIESSARQLEGLSLIVGLATLQALRALGLWNAGLKWPNDVQVQGEKIAGVLLELTGDPADVCHVVIGIGINVNMIDVGGINQPWTSMQLELSRLVDRNEVVNELNRQLFSYLSLHADQGFSVFQEEWEANHIWQGRDVALIAGSHQVRGRVLGIDSQGGLRLCVNGEERIFSGGELSLRGYDDC